MINIQKSRRTSVIRGLTRAGVCHMCDLYDPRDSPDPTPLGLRYHHLADVNRGGTQVGDPIGDASSRDLFSKTEEGSTAV